jgi:hypothetical protein
MGLDMYLGRVKKGTENKREGIDGFDFHEIGYWRKQNHIHKWFVDNCQGGIDECQETEVSKEKLEELLVTCLDIVKNKDNKSLAENELPTQAGFFFGGTEYDEYYFDGIEDTIEILQKVLEETDFEESVITYQSSW